MNNFSILVLGAGELGKAVLRSLAQLAPSANTTLTVLLRPSALDSDAPEKRRDLDELTALGIDFLPGDLADSADNLALLFQNFDTMIVCTGFAAGRSIQLKLAHAALKAGVKRYFPWQFGVDYDVIGRGSAQDSFDEQLDVRDFLRAQDRMEWVIVSTGMFTSFLFEPSFGVVDLARNTVHALGSWETAVTVTTPEDIGTLTAQICFAEPPIVNQVVYTAGDTITYGRLADIVETVQGREIKREGWSVPYLEAELAKDSSDALRKYRVVFAQGRGVAWEIEKTFNFQRGIDTQNVEQWARENLK